MQSDFKSIVPDFTNEDVRIWQITSPSSSPPLPSNSGDAVGELKNQNRKDECQFPLIRLTNPQENPASQREDSPLPGLLDQL